MDLLILPTWPPNPPNCSMSCKPSLHRRRRIGVHQLKIWVGHGCTIFLARSINGCAWVEPVHIVPCSTWLSPDHCHLPNLALKYGWCDSVGSPLLRLARFLVEKTRYGRWSIWVNQVSFSNWKKWKISRECCISLGPRFAWDHRKILSDFLFRELVGIILVQKGCKLDMYKEKKKKEERLFRSHTQKNNSTSFQGKREILNASTLMLYTPTYPLCEQWFYCWHKGDVGVYSI